MHPRYYHELVGGNFRLDALQAALLRVKFSHYTDYTCQRQENAAYYKQNLIDTEGLVLPIEQDGYEHIWNQFTLRILDGRRDDLKNHLAENDIGSEVYYPVPMHMQTCFAELSEDHRTSLTVTDQLAADVLSIPIYPELSRDQQDQVISTIKDFLS
jgi:dTDP-4-amino-4,6-dideoxygalactose transaminase